MYHKFFHAMFLERLYIQENVSKKALFFLLRHTFVDLVESGITCITQC